MVPKTKRKSYFKKPDIALVVDIESVSILESELSNLIKFGGFYYEVLSRKSDLTTKIIVLFFDDVLLDKSAEIMKIKVRLKKFDCELPFK